MDIPYKIFDNFLSDEDHKKVLQFCLESRYLYGESDGESEFIDYIPSGMTKDIIIFDPAYKILSNKILQLCSEVKDLKLDRMYINCFAPNENTYFHIDGTRYTFLYYPQHDWNISEGGETQFYVNETIIGSPPKPNRMIMFSGETLVHRAMSFRNKYRFSIAIKYDSINSDA